MPRNWDPKRWRYAGTNEAGDPMYERRVLDTSDLSSMSKEDLKDLAAQLDLPTSGNKADLVERLQVAGVGA